MILIIDEVAPRVVLLPIHIIPSHIISDIAIHIRWILVCSTCITLRYTTYICIMHAYRYKYHRHWGGDIVLSSVGLGFGGDIYIYKYYTYILVSEHETTENVKKYVGM